MNQPAADDFADHVYDLEIDGLKGRCWRAPAIYEEMAGSTLLVAYGHHSSLERTRGLAQYMRRFGRVVIPDLPGFGGMDSFYRSGRKPTLDNYADYFKACFDTELERGRPVVLVGFSFGFLVVTKFLQKYPEYRSSVRAVVAVVGFAHRDALEFSPSRRRLYISLAKIIRTKSGSAAFRHLCLSRPVLRLVYARTYMARHKFADRSEEEKRRFMDMEISLWHLNDPRTWAFTSILMLTVDLTSENTGLDLHHLIVSGDQFLNAAANEAALQKIYNTVMVFNVDSPTHAPSVIASPEEIAAIMPDALAEALKRSFVR